MHYLKHSGMKDPFEELSFFNLHGLKYLGTNQVNLVFMKMQKPNESITFNTINWLHIHIHMYTDKCRERERDRERERERERDWCRSPL